MYLYGFPIQQLVASSPWIPHNWIVNILISVPAAFLVANVSWRLVENPALRLKSRIPGMEAVALNLFPPRLRALISPA
jgi:peptidoglycan/LPS O-acetylase OafA/YrhL